MAAPGLTPDEVSTPLATDVFEVEPPFNALSDMPTHPLSQLQGPFEESIFESLNSSVLEKVPDLDAPSRRRRLLESTTYDRTCSGKWKQRAGENYHPLWKLAAQLSFGIYLLAEGMAKSEIESLKILQTHVDEIDGFLERTTEDFNLSDQDVQERLDLLKVPLGNLKVLDKMLEDRTFRMSILDGNDKILHVIERSSAALNDTLKDIQKGLEAVSSIGRYLKDLQKGTSDRPQVFRAVHKAMLGNVEGWNNALLDLQSRGERIGESLAHLDVVTSELQRRVGFASRKHMVGDPCDIDSGGFSSISSTPSISRSTSLRETLRETFYSGKGTASPSIRSSLHKPLPICPNPLEPGPKLVPSPRSLETAHGPAARTRSSRLVHSNHRRSVSAERVGRPVLAPVKGRDNYIRNGERMNRGGHEPANAHRPSTAPSGFQSRNSAFVKTASSTEGFDTRSYASGSRWSHKHPLNTQHKSQQPLRPQKSSPLPGLSRSSKRQAPSRRAISIFGPLHSPFKVFRQRSRSHPVLNESSGPSNAVEDREPGPPCHSVEVPNKSSSMISLKANPGGSPRLPHHTPMTCSPVKEHFVENSSSIQTKESEDTLFTALPPLSRPAIAVQSSSQLLHASVNRAWDGNQNSLTSSQPTDNTSNPTVKPSTNSKSSLDTSATFPSPPGRSPLRSPMTPRDGPVKARYSIMPSPVKLGAPTVPIRSNRRSGTPQILERTKTRTIGPPRNPTYTVSDSAALVELFSSSPPTSSSPNPLFQAPQATRRNGIKVIGSKDDQTPDTTATRQEPHGVGSNTPVHDDASRSLEKSNGNYGDSNYSANLQGKKSIRSRLNKRNYSSPWKLIVSSKNRQVETQRDHEKGEVKV
ncbi:hypothetical protein AJ80_07225 [Polytolypa hystricis UAMH7299]|uniref:Uncharacterized protein n=1 Tax=Polytolypa hystricis (strain UAMH7299) TaxID=1447883 RepID=A0A2B7XQG9_POLH7|nr:hypothetical protein AJ80_07225 [Polytolypa hystricis UAMH7299]